jgi:hypothetical protein
MVGPLALTALLIAPLGCAGVDESGENVGDAVEALNTPVLVATPSSLNYGSNPVNSRWITYSVTLTNTGDGTASNISVALPPDPYRVTHNPPDDLVANGSSNAMQITFAPTAAGTYARTITVLYYNPGGTGTPHTLSIPVTGTAY